MKITKFGHCCLLVEEKSLIILTDPGAWNELPKKIGRIDLILITHEHSDHLHIDSLKIILKENPGVEVITNSAVGKLLDKAGIKHTVCASETFSFKNVSIKSFETKHATLYPSVVPVNNTGFMLNNGLFYPGDALFDPKEKVEILALPVAGPWLKLGEAIDYAIFLKPKLVFPVHDGMLKFLGSTHALPQKELEKEGIIFKSMLANDSVET